MNRCPWCGTDPLYVKYHDEEWGVPVQDDNRHFEFLVLESMQAGLSWYIVLKKRENFRKAFAGFKPEQVAVFDHLKIESLVQDAGIIRNRAKIMAAVNNAGRFLEVQEEFGSFNEYIWGFVGHQPIINHWNELSQIPVSTPLSYQVSKDMKQRGFKFLGTTVMYAHMQAIGMINDHLTGCVRWKQVQE